LKLNKNKNDYFKHLENLTKIKNYETLQLTQIKSEETIRLAEIKVPFFLLIIYALKFINPYFLMQSKNLQDHTTTVVEFHKDIADDLITIDRKRKISPPDTLAEVRYLALYH
jgi:hypothetical protein